MCGIWVSLNLPSTLNDPDLRALDAVAHRGPDGRKLISIPTPAGALHMGHHRLSIYDFDEAASQPMQRDHLTIVFNGSIYNFKALRSELSSSGVRFSTESDTEVLLAAWRTWQSAMFARLDGMFAMVIHDQKRQELTIARDRFGEKPLHIWRSHDRQGFAIASEIRQFSKAGIADRTLNWETAKIFLDSGVAESGSSTFIKNIERIAPRSLVTINLSGPHWSLLEERFCERYRPQADPNLADSRVAAEALRDALRQSVALRLVADVPVGSCLSGGLDSSSIVRLAAQHLPDGQKLECVFASFNELDGNGRPVGEQKYAAAAADLPNINLHHVTPSDEEVSSCLDHLCEHQGEPFASTSIIAQRMVFARAKELGLKVMLDGQAADELLVGYSGMLTFGLADILAKKGLRAMSAAAKTLSLANDDVDLEMLKRSAVGAILPESLRREIARLRGNWPPRDTVTFGKIRNAPKAISGLSRLETNISHLLTDLSLPSLLRYEDRNSMTFGIESRLPFLGLDLTRVISAIPAQTMFENGRSKSPLRLAMRGIVPDLIIDRREKMGFQAPSNRWISGPLRTWMEQGIEHACKALPNLVDVVKVKKLARMTSNQSDVIFRVASLGNWMLLNQVEI